MNSKRPSRQGLSRLRSLCTCTALLSSFLLIALRANAQDVAEAARQEKTRKAAEPKRQPHVYTNDDLKRSQILTQADRASIEARKKDAILPPAGKSSPSIDASNGAPSETLGDIARRYRSEKTAREAEQARKAQPPSLFHMDLPQPSLAHPMPLRAPLLPPSSLPSKIGKPGAGLGPFRRDPFSRPIISPAVRSTTSAPAPKSAAPFRPSPVLPPALARSSPSASENHQGVVRIQTGDSLWNLARQYLGRGSRWHEWLNINPSLSDPRRIKPGTILVVPLSGPRSRVLPPSRVVVRLGDSLWKIAATHFGWGSSWPCLAQANPDLRDVDRIYPGQTLVLPATCRATHPSPEALSAPPGAGRPLP
jgi:nucleoid-associated protein YgaU